tara:strand:+ start:38 stop:256 length:219 start_codon:yes stop_codon:yes gene_type:complete
MDRAEKLKHYMAQFKDEGNVDIVVNPDGSTIRKKIEKDSALSSTEDDSLQDEDDLRDYREQQAQDNGGYPEE